MTASAPERPLPAMADPTFARAVALHRAGQLQEAVKLYHTILQAQPNHPEASHNLGTVAVDLGQPATALPLFIAALNADPTQHRYWVSYIGALIQANQPDDARQTLEFARQHGLAGPDIDALAARLNEVAADPVPADELVRPTQTLRPSAIFNPAQTPGTNAEGIGAAIALLGQDRRRDAGPCEQAPAILSSGANAHGNPGNLPKNPAHLKQTEGGRRRAKKNRSGHAQELNNRGARLQELGRLDEAETTLREALKVAPNSFEVLSNLGNVLKAQRRMDEAEACYRKSLKINPKFADAHNNLGALYQEQNRLEQAAACYRRATEINPGFAVALSNLGATLQKLGFAEESETSYRRALASDPDYADIYINLGSLLIQQGRLYEAVQYCENAVRLTPNNPFALSNMGVVLQDLGHHHTARECFRRALQSNPDFISAMDNLLFNANYDPDMSAEEVFATYDEYDARYGVPLRSEWKPHANSRDINRRLKVGYVSPDFRKHSARHFLEPLLSQHDKRAVEVYAYSDTMHEDEVTARYRSYADCWIPTIGLTDAELAARIRADGIDILVELAGHTLGNRLGVFARKPAPVSLTWMGYGNTTGLSAIDYFLTDPVSAPPGSDHLFSERPWRIDNPDIPYRPAGDMGAVSPLPALNNGCVTFCTLTRRIRINHRTIRVWSEILKRVDHARLVVNSRDFQDPTAQKVLEDEFAAHGIPREQLRIGCQSPPWDVLRNVDIGLDCFPHNSGTTLLETLYMGVPYVTLADRVRVGRIGSSMLCGAGHPEWIANTEEEYIEKAVALARDLPALARIRANLRGEMHNLPLMDEAGFARRVETAYREMFRRWAQPASNETPNIDRLLQQAVSLHETGQLQEAGELYRSILDAEPGHAKANFNMGALAVQMTQPEAGLPFFSAALDAEPTRAQFWIGYIDALIQAEHLDEAREVLTLARQHGLDGNPVDALDERLQQLRAQPAARNYMSKPAPHVAANRPDHPREINPPPADIRALVALLDSRNYADADALAQTFTARFPAHHMGWLVRGVALNRLGRHADALGPMQRAVELAPNDTDAHLNLGIVFKNLGRLDDAITCYRNALRITPGLAEAHYNLGNTLKDLNRMEEALACYQEALHALPNSELVLNNLGATLQQLGRHDEAEPVLRRAVRIRPDSADVHFNLGNTLKSTNRLEEAEAGYQRAIRHNPEHLQAHLALGAMQKARGQLHEALASFHRARDLDPNDAELHATLGCIQTDLKRPDEAEASYRRALQINPRMVEALNNLANLLTLTRREAEAEALLRRALEIMPHYTEAHYNLGNVLAQLGRLVEARRAYERALQLDPAFLPAHQNMVTLITHLSDFSDLVARSDATLKLNPDAPISWEQRLYTFSYHPDLTAEQIFTEFVRWGERHPVPVTDFSRHDRTAGRRLRIGFVSPDFRNHTSRFYFLPMFANHDHGAVEMFAYSNVLVEDDVTPMFKPLFDHWRNIRGVSDENVVQMIRNDRIDILVDGCNHMLDDRLGVFALKPAPIQVTWLGAAWTTGLKQIDYVLFDPYIAPEGTLSSETIMRLPHCFIAYQPKSMVEVKPPPALKNGHLTFGYSGRSERLNHHTFRVWGEILRRIPNARLILDYRGFADPLTQAHFRELMRTHGLDPDRVTMRCSANIFEGLHDFDVLLDCFPHSGGTMLTDALWMGVPALTLAGRPPLGRIGTTFMTNLGLPEWIATSHDDYIEKAVALTKDVDTLASLRAGMRERMRNSPLMDGPGFARHVEQAYRTMYEKWRQQ